jgi:DNA-binding winged helix-turn-helix (wHTH) protein/Tfp pilus assembly protein PilF
MAPKTNHQKLKRIRFGPFRFDPASGELERCGVKVHIQQTPARLLAELSAAPGTLHTRAELCARLWPAGVHVDFENNLNNAVARLRQALGVEGSSYIETIPQRGYRFTGNIHRESTELPVPFAEALRKGRAFRNRTTVRDLWRAVEYFRQAIEAEPDSAGAWAQMSDAYVLLGDDVLGGLPGREALPRAAEFAHRALEIDPRCAAAHTSLAMVAWRLNWDWRVAEERFREAVSLDSRNADAFQYYSWLLQAAGRSREAREAMLRALALDSTSSFISTNVGWMLYLDRRYSEALSQLRKTLAIDPSYALARLPLGYTLQQTGCINEAVAHFKFGLARSGDTYYKSALGQALALAGFKGQASAMLADPEPGSAYSRAMIHAALGHEEETVQSLESAAAEHSSALPYLQVDPIFDCFRRNRRYQEIAHRVGLV